MIDTPPNCSKDLKPKNCRVSGEAQVNKTNNSGNNETVLAGKGTVFSKASTADSPNLKSTNLLAPRQFFNVKRPLNQVCRIGPKLSNNSDIPNFCGDIDKPSTITISNQENESKQSNSVDNEYSMNKLNLHHLTKTSPPGMLQTNPRGHRPSFSFHLVDALPVKKSTRKQTKIVDNSPGQLTGKVPSGCNSVNKKENTKPWAFFAHPSGKPIAKESIEGKPIRRCSARHSTRSFRGLSPDRPISGDSSGFFNLEVEQLEAKAPKRHPNPQPKGKMVTKVLIGGKNSSNINFGDFRVF